MTEGVSLRKSSCEETCPYVLTHLFSVNSERTFYVECIECAMDIFGVVEREYRAYRGEKKVYGLSAEGRPLVAFFVGEHRAPVQISQYAIHGREWVTALLALEHLKRGVQRGGAWILPLTDPDGALLSRVGITSLSEGRRALALSLNKKSYDFSLWKANAEGVDLNVNFDARWGTGVSNITTPAPENYIGTAPLSAPESRALWSFTEEVSPAATVSWHTKGEEIYWRFHQPPLRSRRDRRLAEVLSAVTGYPLGEAKGSAGGYKDMCIERLKIPAFTVECGRAQLRHPLGEEQAGEIIEKCKDALSALSEALV